MLCRFVADWGEGERVVRREGCGNIGLVVGRSAADRPVVDKLIAVGNSQRRVEVGWVVGVGSYSFVWGVVR